MEVKSGGTSSSRNPPSSPEVSDTPNNDPIATKESPPSSPSPDHDPSKESKDLDPSEESPTSPEVDPSEESPNSPEVDPSEVSPSVMDPPPPPQVMRYLDNFYTTEQYQDLVMSLTRYLQDSNFTETY